MREKRLVHTNLLFKFHFHCPYTTTPAKQCIAIYGRMIKLKNISPKFCATKVHRAYKHYTASQKSSLRLFSNFNSRRYLCLALRGLDLIFQCILIGQTQPGSAYYWNDFACSYKCTFHMLYLTNFQFLSQWHLLFLLFFNFNFRTSWLSSWSLGLFLPMHIDRIASYMVSIPSSCAHALPHIDNKKQLDSLLWTACIYPCPCPVRLLFFNFILRLDI